MGKKHSMADRNLPITVCRYLRPQPTSLFINLYAFFDARPHVSMMMALRWSQVFELRPSLMMHPAPSSPLCQSVAARN